MPFAPAAAASAPLFSVVIPTYNRPHQIPDLLKSWAAVDFPHDSFELLLLDDGGDFDLAPLVAAQAEKLPVRLFRLPHRGLSATRQSGLEQARGRYYLCTDDDCRPHQNILRAYAAALSRHPEAALGGTVHNLLLDDWFATTTQEIITFATARWNQNPENAHFFNGSSIVFPTETLRRIGGFDPSWIQRTGEDRDLCRRWEEAGHRLVSVPDALMGHAHHLHLRSFLRQHFHYGQGNYHTQRRRTRPGAGAPNFSGISFYLALLAYPFQVFSGTKALAIFTLILCAQVATLAGLLQAWHRDR